MKALGSPEYPRFAVVGHPNKGKSSIVASLAMDESVQISDTPGTTSRTRSFPLKVDGRVLYEMYDTPGFQRARQVLAWLVDRGVGVAKRPDAVREFIYEHRDDPRFVDEVELLSPIMDGAVIIYVVDGSKPYGDEYEAEMEILRWTGQPSMALINLIGQTNYVDEWKGVLGQYFKLIRQYDPMKRSFNDHITLLEGIAQLKEEWIEPLGKIIEEFKHYRERLVELSSSSIANLISGALSHVEEISFGGEHASDEDRGKLTGRYQDSIRSMERKTQRHIEEIWHHVKVEKEQSQLELEGIDLFSKESESIFGLSRKELVYAGVAAGAATGAGVDLLFAGHTLLLGCIIGGAVGGLGAYVGFDQISDIRVLGTRLGSQKLAMGPMENRNFPYILLGRAIYHAHVMASRSHATRGRVELGMDEEFRDKWFDDDLGKKLEKYHKKFRSGDEVDSEDVEGYKVLVRRALERVL